MNTTILRTTTSPPARPVSRLGLIDRTALGIGITLITWANHSEERRTRHLARQSARAGRAYQLARQRSEREREQARLEPSLLFRNLQ
jgi:hypothetical protein